MTTTTELKRSRAEIAAQTEAFLKSGGKIKRFGSTEPVSLWDKQADKRKEQAMKASKVAARNKALK